MIILNNLLLMHLQMLQKFNSKKAKATGDLIGNGIPDKTAEVWRNLIQNSSVTNQTKNIGIDREIPSKKKNIYIYIYPEK